ncbi:MAG: multidrug effflux MFS transporter [Pseudomonadota bacterium]
MAPPIDTTPQHVPETSAHAKTPVRFLDRATPPHIGTLITITSVGALTMSIFLPSLPGMARDFQTEYWLVQLSVPLYLMMNAVLQLFIGPIADRYGRRPVLLGSFTLFLLATLGCALAPNIESFLAFRMVQAVIVAGLVLGRTVVRDMHGTREAASMIGYVTMGMAVVPMVGPLLGGVLDEAFGWRASFGALFALGAFALWLIWRDLGETAPTAQGTRFRDQIAQYPLLFGARRFWGYSLAAAFSSGAFFAYLGGAPYVGSEVFAMNPTRLGFFLGAPAVGYFLGNYLSGRFSVRIGIDPMMLTGAFIAATGMSLSCLAALTGLQNEYVFFGFMTFVGLGNGMLLPNAMSGLLSVRPQLAGTASGLGGSLMIGGGSVLSILAAPSPGDTELPLVTLMLISSTLGVIASGYTYARNKRLAGEG